MEESLRLLINPKRWSDGGFEGTIDSELTWERRPRCNTCICQPWVAALVVQIDRFQVAAKPVQGVFALLVLE